MFLVELQNPSCGMQVAHCQQSAICNSLSAGLNVLRIETLVLHQQLAVWHLHHFRSLSLTRSHARTHTHTLPVHEDREPFVASTKSKERAASCKQRAHSATTGSPTFARQLKPEDTGKILNETEHGCMQLLAFRNCMRHTHTHNC